MYKGGYTPARGRRGKNDIWAATGTAIYFSLMWLTPGRITPGVSKCI